MEGVETTAVPYEVMARKWRPQDFSSLVGQEHVATTLLNALRSQRLAHALLFTGVRGTGKTSSARILAKSLRCPQAVDCVPCGVCPECLDIAASRSVDVVEIDGASNNGVDAIRELRETVHYRPASGKHKVYIIDEVHMLTTAAFNALLKTLEEPPSHVVFILATTEPQKIPATILSRCQRYDFRRIGTRLIAEHLERICKAENIAAEPEAVWLVARQADGSMRDGQSLLDQVVTFAGRTLTLATVTRILGLTDRGLIRDTLTALLNRSPRDAVTIVGSLRETGQDAKLFAQELLESIRHALMAKMAPRDVLDRLIDLPDSDINELVRMVKTTPEAELHYLFDLCLKSVGDIGKALDAQLVLEVCLLRMASAPSLVSLGRFLEGLGSSAEVAGPVPPPRQAPAPTPTTAPAAAATTIAAAPPEAKPATSGAPSPFVRRLPAYEEVLKKRQPAAPVPPPSPSAAEPPSDEAATHTTSPPVHTDPWSQFVAQVSRANGLLGAMLGHTQLIERTPQRLIVGVPQRVAFILDKLRDPENVRRIEQFADTIWGVRLKVEVRLVEAAAEAQTPRAAVLRAEASEQESLEKAIDENPLVKSVRSVFKTQVRSVRDR